MGKDYETLCPQNDAKADLLSYREQMNRRLILALIAGAVAFPGMVHAVPAPQPTRRRLRLVNPHTGEAFNGLYRDDHGPLATAMADLSVFLRDFHSGATIGVDLGVIDFLAAVMDAVDAQSATILSAYRTSETNAMLQRTTFGVAENSQHLYGRALDIRIGARLAEAMLAARAMQRGGVGWYPQFRVPPYQHGTGAQLGSRRERPRLAALRWRAFPLRRQRAIGNPIE